MQGVTVLIQFEGLNSVCKEKNDLFVIIDIGRFQ